MISPDAFIEVISKLPPLMQTLTKHHGLIDQAIALEDAHHLNGKQAKAMMNLEVSMIAQEFPPADILKYVTQEMNMEPAPAKKFTVDFIGKICLPMQWYIGNVEGLIKELGGDVANYVAEAQRIFPEVYNIKNGPPQPIAAAIKPIPANEPPILHNLEEKLSSNKGRAGILLHLTNLSLQIEQRVATKSLTVEAGQELIHGLDSLSYAVNTKDLNPLEIAAIKRKILSVLTKLGHLTA